MTTVHAYLRVSTDRNQTTDNQRKLIEDAGFRVDHWHSEDGVSGSIKALERPAFKDMIASLREGDVCICTMVDRLGRDTADVLHTIAEFKRLGIGLKVLQFGGVDVTSSMGKLIVTVMAAVAEMERNMLIERTKAGIARTRAAGTKMGAPFKTTPEEMADICRRKNKGDRNNDIARDFGIPIGTIGSLLKRWNGKIKEYTAEYELRKEQHTNSRARRTI